MSKLKTELSGLEKDGALRRAGQAALRLAGVLAAVGGVSYFDFVLARVNSTTAGFTYLVAVLLISALAGTAEALTASIAATVCFNYFFLPPVLTLTIADPQNWVALFAFLTTALVASRLAANLKLQTAEALKRRWEMELLYALSRAILLAEPADSIVRQIAFNVASIFEFQSVGLLDGRTGDIVYAGPEDFSAPSLRQDMRESAVSGVAINTPVSGGPSSEVQIVSVRLGGQPIGSLAVRPRRISETALDSVCNLVAIALERKRGLEETTRRDAERRGETLRSTLVDAIAHEFKTPLTSIKAAGSMLVANTMGAEPDSGRARELGAVVTEEADRLDRLVTEAIQMTALGSGRPRLDRQEIAASEVIALALRQSQSMLDGHAVTVIVAPEAETIFGDRELLAVALRQLLDNAAKYSGPGSSIEVRAEPYEGGTRLEVRDPGPGIPVNRHEQIFEKFYRGPETSANIVGTGMGLSIVREIARAHGGTAGVRSKPGEGSRFSIAIPAAGKGLQPTA